MEIIWTAMDAVALAKLKLVIIAMEEILIQLTIVALRFVVMA